MVLGISISGTSTLPTKNHVTLCMIIMMSMQNSIPIEAIAFYGLAFIIVSDNLPNKYHTLDNTNQLQFKCSTCTCMF